MGWVAASEALEEDTPHGIYTRAELDAMAGRYGLVRGPTARDRRDREIRDARHDGMSIPAIMKRWRLSERTCYRILNGR